MQASSVHGVVLREAATVAVRAPMTVDALFSTYAGFVWHTLRHFGVAPVDLEDQTQGVFLVAHRRLEQWDGQQARPWLYAIARRCAAAYRRQAHRRHEYAFETLPEGEGGHDPSDRAELGLLNRVLQSLDENKRAVFLLYEIEEMSMRDVAESVQCPLQTAYTWLYAARREVARALEDKKSASIPSNRRASPTRPPKKRVRCCAPHVRTGPVPPPWIGWRSAWPRRALSRRCPPPPRIDRPARLGWRLTREESWRWRSLEDSPCPAK